MSISKIATLLLSIALTACAAQPKPANSESLLKTEWLLEDLGGKGVLDRVQATLAFPEANKVAGNASCNRFFGTAEFNGETVKFSKLGSTRMACRSPAVSNQETSYLRALENAERFRIDGPFLLIYSKGLDQPLRYTRFDNTQKQAPK